MKKARSDPAALGDDQRELLAAAEVQIGGQICVLIGDHITQAGVFSDERVVEDDAVAQLRARTDGDAAEEIRQALSEYADYVAAQTLSLSLEQKPLAEAPQTAAEVEWGAGTIRIQVAKHTDSLS